MGPAFDACKLQVGEGLESSRHHVEYRALFAAKYTLSDLERRFRTLFNQVQHLGLAIPMMLDNLVGAMAVIAVDASMGGQHRLYLETLNFQLRVYEISQW